MSAIAGIWQRQGDSGQESPERMLHAMLHRTGGHYSLHQNSHQKTQVQIAGRFGIEDSLLARYGVVAVLDGQLHSLDSLQQELEAKGHVFENPSAELLVTCAYLEWKEKCLVKLRGDFVCAILDREQECIILARDPLAKRQIYWFRDSNVFLFASEIKALMATGLIPSRISIEGLAAYLALGFYPLQLTPLVGMYKLLPGYFLRIGAAWGCSTHYYGPDNAPVESNFTSNLGGVLQERMDACVEQEPKYHSAGCMFSGGLGSCVLAHTLAHKQRDQHLELWSVEWEGSAKTATKEAQEIARGLSIPCNIALLKPTAMLQEMMSLVWYLDEPVMNMEVWALWKVVRSGFASTEALYSAYGLDSVLARVQEEPDSPSKDVQAVDKIFWSPSYLLKRAAPQLMRQFDPQLFSIQIKHIQGIPHLLEPRIDKAYVTQILFGVYQPAEHLTSSCGMVCRTPYMNARMLIALQDVLQKDPFQIVQQLEQTLSQVMPLDALSKIRGSSRMTLPPWSYHPVFIQAFELLKKGVLVRSGWVERAWVSDVLNDPKQREEAFGLLLAMLQWEVWYKMFIEGNPSEHPPSLSVLQFLHH